MPSLPMKVAGMSKTQITAHRYAGIVRNVFMINSLK